MHFEWFHWWADDGPKLYDCWVLIDFPLTVTAVTLIFIPRRGSAISSAKQGKLGSIHNLVKN